MAYRRFSLFPEDQDYETPPSSKLQLATFVVSSSESSPEAAPSTGLPIWDLLQVDQGVGERLPVHVEHLTSELVLPRPAQHQGQLEQEDMELLVGCEMCCLRCAGAFRDI